MTYHAHIKPSGELLGWYNKEIHTDIPTPNVEVAEEVWQQAIEDNANFYDKKAGKFSVKDFRTKTQKLKGLKRQKRSERDAALQELLWMADRHNQQVQLGIETTLTDLQYLALLGHIQALRDYPQQPEYWLKELPKWSL